MARNGRYHMETELKKDDDMERKGTAKERIGHFTWAWFACTMSTGALAVVLAQTPYRFPGLNTIGKIFFILDLVLFIGFTITIVIRFSRKARVMIKSLHHPSEALFFGSFWVSVSLILNCAQQYGVPECGPWLVKALEVCFWIYSGCALCVAIFQYATLFVAERLDVSTAMPAWVFPVYPFLVIGPLAGAMIPDQPQEAALNIFIGAITLQGLGWIVALFMYTIYVMRLMSSELPSPPTRPGMYISVGPVGYTAAALVALGNQAPSVIPEGFLGVTTVPVGDILKIIGVMGGIFLCLLSFWFFALSSLAVLTGVRRMSFTLNWWAFIFPNAGMTLALIQIANVLNSPAIKAITSALTILLVIMWFFVGASHIFAVVKKEILFEGKDEDDGMDV